jgi:hypothetical protein
MNAILDSEERFLNINVGLKEQSATQFTATIVINLVTPKSAAKQELLLSKPASRSYSLHQLMGANSNY